MSAFATPTLIPRPPLFPPLLFRPPQPPHPVPLPRHGRIYGHLNTFRDILREMEDLSDEEVELEDINTDVRLHGFKHIIPIGKLFTQQEEKNDADDDSETDSQGHSAANTPALPSGDEHEMEEEAQDLDASMEDLDEQEEEEEEEEEAEEEEEEEEDGMELGDGEEQQ